MHRQWHGAEKKGTKRDGSACNSRVKSVPDKNEAEQTVRQRAARDVAHLNRIPCVMSVQVTYFPKEDPASERSNRVVPH